MTRMLAGASAALALLAAATQAQAITVTTAYSYVLVAPQQVALAQAYCPRGTVLLGGGWDTNPNEGRYLNVWVNRQVSTNSWRVMAINSHGSANLSIQAYALCASGVSGLSSYSYSMGVGVPGGAGEPGNMYCPWGGTPTGGGFDSNYPYSRDLVPLASYPDNNNQWVTWEYNSNNPEKSFTAYVTCTVGLPGYVYTSWSGTTVINPPYSWGSAVASCNRGDVALGGGFYNSVTPLAELQYVRPVSSRRSGSGQWTATAFNDTQYRFAFVNAYVRCLH